MAADTSTARYWDYVVVGGGVAGVMCAKTIAENSKEAVLLLSSSPLLKGVMQVQDLTENISEFSVQVMRGEDLTDAYPSIEVKYDGIVEHNSAQRMLRTTQGTTIQYGKLCICSGSRPSMPISKKHMIGIRDMESANDLRSRLGSSRRLVIVGNGALAMELADQVSTCSVVLIARSSHIGNAYFDEDVSSFFMDAFVEKGPQACESHDDHAENLLVVDGATVGNVDDDVSRELRKKYVETGSMRERLMFGTALGPRWTQQIFEPRSRTETPGSKGSVLQRIRNLTVLYDLEVQSVEEVLGREQDECIAVEDAFCQLPGNQWKYALRLKNGKSLLCDAVVSATGVDPNVEFVDRSILRGHHGGLVVDGFFRTSDAHVYAAGDCCTVDWKCNWTVPPAKQKHDKAGVANPENHWFQHRLWSQARAMGVYAGFSMIGDMDALASQFSFEFFSHVTHFFGYKVVLLGVYRESLFHSDYSVKTLYRHVRGQEFVKVLLVDGKVQGAVLVGETGLEETMEHLILDQLDVSCFGDELLSPHIDLEDYFD